MIEFEQVNVSFKRKHEKFDVLKNVSLRIHDGDVFEIVGSSGAGKSTILRTINQLQAV